jgi:hypothetical protein
MDFPWGYFGDGKAVHGEQMIINTIPNSACCKKRIVEIRFPCPLLVNMGW